MSYIEEDNMLTAPWVGQTSYKNGLTIAVLAVNRDIVENISEALIHVHKKEDFQWKIIVLRCIDLERIISQSDITGRVGIDFMVIAIDLSTVFCIEWVKKMLDKVHPDLKMRRVVLVNPCGLSIDSMAVNTSDVLSFCKENKLEMINANIAKMDEAEYLAQRLLNYIGASIGYKTGIPNLNLL
ncbi:uncharacterized protein LOC123714195 [Pieris brassicae]|uniref:uncharacterized protein LOC123714195 n=1 Tax=Pieris brassicae TaxID=7116 RepID=UPI001E65EC5E|nr:uncharacterized protein LOC123714195 [Pieris brassicae]